MLVVVVLKTWILDPSVVCHGFPKVAANYCDKLAIRAQRDWHGESFW